MVPRPPRWRWNHPILRDRKAVVEVGSQACIFQGTLAGRSGHSELDMGSPGFPSLKVTGETPTNEMAVVMFTVTILDWTGG